MDKSDIVVKITASLRRVGLTGRPQNFQGREEQFKNILRFVLVAPY